jgi:anaerobic selenocysteine-containing dehydrogenase
MLRKLDQESDLRPRYGEAWVHPETAARYGVQDGGEARITTACGVCRLRVRVDAAVAPETVEAACGPNLADLCETGAPTRARMEAA